VSREFRIPLREVEEELPLAKLWALYAWSIENNPWGSAERTSLGYVGQELKERLNK